MRHSKIATRYVFSWDIFFRLSLSLFQYPLWLAFLDWTTARSCCLLSCSVSLCGKLYSLHAQIDPDGAEILIAQYICGYKQLICFELSFISQVNGAVLVDYPANFIHSLPIWCTLSSRIDAMSHTESNLVIPLKWASFCQKWRLKKYQKYNIIYII